MPSGIVTTSSLFVHADALAGRASATTTTAKSFRATSGREGSRVDRHLQSAAMDQRPVGVFDSGMGGLTVLHECLVTMPHEDFVYLCDAARLPYGPRPLPEIRRYARELGRFLESQDVKLIVAACNAATSAGLPQLQEELQVP